MDKEKIPQEWLDYRDALIIPKGYHLSWTSLWAWFLAKDDETASFRLTDRTFDDVDLSKKASNPIDNSDINYWTRGAISESIESVIDKKGKAIVLDLACGPLNKAAYQIAQIYGSEVEVKAVDIVGSKESLTAHNLERKVGSALELPYPDESMDVIYSFQFMDHLITEEKKKVLEETMRIMSKDSFAVLDVLDTFGSDNKWLRNYHPPSQCGMPEFFNPFMFEWEFPFKDSTIHFEPIKNTPTCAPGWTTLGGSEPSSYLLLTKTEGRSVIL